MEYRQPVGKIAGAPYVDGNRSAGLRGDTPPAAAIEHPMRELVHLIEYAGLIPSKDDLQQVRKAVQMIFEAMSGEGPAENFLTLLQASSRLPIYPEVQSADGRINVTSPAAGTVLVPPTVSFLHRGIAPINTSDYDEDDRAFSTDADKTYHLRWSAADGFSLKDLASGAYNPTAAAETSVAFDSTYDDMLIARVTTNSGNIATITNLTNKARILMEIENDGEITTNPAANLAERTAQITWNLSRTPVMSAYPKRITVLGDGGFSANASHDHDFLITRLTFSRYGCSLRLMRDHATRFDILATVSA